MPKFKNSVINNKSIKKSNRSEPINYFGLLNNLDNNDNDINLINDSSINTKNINKKNVILSKQVIIEPIEEKVNSPIRDTQLNKINNDVNSGVNSGDNDGDKSDNIGWKSVEPKKKQKNFRTKITNNNNYHNYNNYKNNYNDNKNTQNFDFEFEKDKLDILDVSDDGSIHKLETQWYIWTHQSESTNWTTESYKHIFTIDSLKSFWEFFGNIDKLDIIKHQFYIMRKSSSPTWEHESNRHGGICSVRVIKDRSIEIIEQISILILNESFSDNPSDINGISFCVKHNWGVVKIWNGTAANDISTQIPMYMLKRYSASPRFVINEPEY